MERLISTTNRVYLLCVCMQCAKIMLCSARVRVRADTACDLMALFVYSFALHCCKVRHTALKFGTPQVKCSGEADRELAAAAAAAALGGVPTVVLGRDTDFCFYAGCS